jgi:hypothetical protein
MNYKGRLPAGAVRTIVAGCVRMIIGFSDVKRALPYSM